MSPRPTGRLFRADTGIDLELRRTFRAPIDDVWASVTESDRTARWFGPWTGDGKPGATIQVQMKFEETAPWCEMTIESCDAPRHLGISMTDDNGVWRTDMHLTETAGVTELRFVQHLTADSTVADSVGPGWEYYLDMLVAAREDQPLPSFDDYFPAQREYYLRLMKEIAND